MGREYRYYFVEILRSSSELFGLRVFKLFVFVVDFYLIEHVLNFLPFFFCFALSLR